MPKKPLKKWTTSDWKKLYKILKWKPDKATNCHNRPCNVKGHRHWGRIKEACDEFGVDRATIRRAIKISRGKPPSAWAKKIKPKLVTKWEETDAYDAIREHKYFKSINPIGYDAWLYTGQIDPKTWLEFHVKLLRKKEYKGRINPLFKEETGDISPEKRTNINRMLEACGRGELTTYLKHVPKVKPKRREWYLREPMLYALIGEILEPDTLMYLYTGVIGGERHSARGSMKTGAEYLDFEANEFKVYEHKRKEWVSKDAPPKYMRLLKQFLDDFGIKGRIFRCAKCRDKPYHYVCKRCYNRYKTRLTKAGGRAGIRAKVTTHILKHTFVTQASLHMVPIGIISDQTGTEEDTLKKYYRGDDRMIRKFYLQGIEPERKPYIRWIEDDVAPRFYDRYFEIRDRFELVNGIRRLEEPKRIRRPKPKRSASKRPFSWERIKAITKGKAKTEKGKRLIAYWRKVWKLHKEHPRLTFAEIKAKYLK